MTTTDEAAALEVMQADRDAVASLYSCVETKKLIAAGASDDGAEVQAFARHRTTERDRLLASQERAIAEAVAAKVDAVTVYRACMIANGDKDPGGAAAGMLENSSPPERDYCELLAHTIRDIKGTEHG